MDKYDEFINFIAATKNDQAKMQAQNLISASSKYYLLYQQWAALGGLRKSLEQKRGLSHVDRVTLKFLVEYLKHEDEKSNKDDQERIQRLKANKKNQSLVQIAETDSEIQKYEKRIADRKKSDVGYLLYILTSKEISEHLLDIRGINRKVYRWADEAQKNYKKMISKRLEKTKSPQADLLSCIRNDDISLKKIKEYLAAYDAMPRTIDEREAFNRMFSDRFIDLLTQYFPADQDVLQTMYFACGAIPAFQILTEKPFDRGDIKYFFKRKGKFVKELKKELEECEECCKIIKERINLIEETMSDENREMMI